MVVSGHGAGRRTTSAVLFTLLLVLGMTACSASGGGGGNSGGSEESGGLTKVIIANTPDSASLDIYLAKKLGYFRNNGIDASIKYVTSIAQLPAVVNQGQYTIGEVTPSILINAAGQGLELTAIAGNHLDTPKNRNFHVVTKASSSIKSLTDLGGKTFGTPAVGGSASIATLYYLYKHGADWKGTKQVAGAGAALPSLLDRGRVDAITTQPPYDVQVRGPKYRDLGDPYRVMGDNVVSTVYIAKASWAKSHRDVVKRYLAALSKADSYIAKHPMQANETLTEFAGLSKSQVKSIPGQAFTARLPANGIGIWARALQDLGLLKKKVDVKSLQFSA